MMDKQYMAGSNVKYYPEMEYLLNKKTIDYYFGITTFLYIITLGIVLYRANLFSYMVVFVLLLYIACELFHKNANAFSSSSRNYKIYIGFNPIVFSKTSGIIII